MSIGGLIVLTASQYVDCWSHLPDEFLDIACAYPNPSLPVFPPQWNTHPLLLGFLKMSHNRGGNLLGPALRL